jgi:serine/arginine repetitive matrix protein 2
MRNKRKAGKSREAGKHGTVKSREAEQLDKQKSPEKQNSGEAERQRNRKAEKQNIKEAEKQRSRKAEKQRSRNTQKNRDAGQQGKAEKQRSREKQKSRKPEIKKTKRKNNPPKNNLPFFLLQTPFLYFEGQSLTPGMLRTSCNQSDFTIL